MKTIAQQLNVKVFPFIIKDSKGNEIYQENSVGFWSKYEYNSKGNKIYRENSDGYWSKCEYNSKGNEIYREYSSGYAIDNKTKSVPEYTMEELTKMLGNFKIKK